ncbi:MAG: ABC transporter ATP-binding protein [Truepera sp.]|nr:ABC transporter ATP-binding protein [Truepera sp.]
MSGSLLQVQGLSRSFGGLRAVDALSFDVAVGEIVGLIGPNGSGKTTALNLISGMLRMDQGSVRFDGRELSGAPVHAIARAGIARTFQLVRVFQRMTVRENVQAGLMFGRGDHRADPSALLAQVGLSEREWQIAGQLTYIDQKRLELARALALQPRLLLLDEWLAGLNPSELVDGIKLVHTLRGAGVAVLMVEHVMEAIRPLCDRCVVMNAGCKIAEGTPQAVLSDRLVIEAYLGEDDV